eukprot:scaffold252693_cov71-Attheya_sp.AAC.1
MAIAIHPHSDPRNHLTCLYFVYLLVHALKVFDAWVADLLVENTMRVAWLFLGSEYGLSWGRILRAGGVLCFRASLCVVTGKLFALECVIRMFELIIASFEPSTVAMLPDPENCGLQPFRFPSWVVVMFG